MRRVLAAVCVAGLLLGACGGDDGGGGADRDETDATDTVSVDTTEVVPITAAEVTSGSASAVSTAPPRPVTTPAAQPAGSGTSATTAAARSTLPESTAPASTVAAPISFTNFKVSRAGECAAPDVSVAVEGPTVEIEWKLAGVIPDDVYVAVDNQDGPYETGLPTQCSYDLRYPCDGNEHTYYVVAVLDGQQFVKSKKV